MKYFFTLLMASVLVLTACENGKNPAFSSVGDPTSEIPIESLREDLWEFDNFAQSTLIESANVIISESKSTVEKRNAIKWKIEALSQIRENTFEDDPLEGLVKTWSWTIRHCEFFETGDGLIFFTDSNTKARTTALSLREEIEKIAVHYLPKNSFNEMRTFAEGYARSHPMRGNLDDSFAVSGNREVDRTTIIGRIASLPASPLLAISKVGQTSNSISDISITAERFADIAEDFPRELRWQAEILSNGLLENAEIVAVRQSLESTAKSIDRMTVVAENLPESTQVIIRDSIHQIENTAPKIEAILNQANEVTTSLNEGIKSSEIVTAELQILSK